MPAAAGASNLILIVGVSLELIYFAAVCTLLYYNARLLVEICKKVCKVFKERDVQKKETLQEQDIEINLVEQDSRSNLSEHKKDSVEFRERGKFPMEKRNLEYYLGEK
ncbi:MAG TPA: hypothetical protein GX687_06130 [Clostridia bacterium]|jgi:hypothetical protein|nr:hypothetical protein [Clostridia bacterium]